MALDELRGTITKKKKRRRKKPPVVDVRVDAFASPPPLRL
jgi:hypothetical protein